MPGRGGVCAEAEDGGGKTLSQMLQLEEGLHEDEVGKHGHWPGLRAALDSWSLNSTFY